MGTRQGEHSDHPVEREHWLMFSEVIMQTTPSDPESYHFALETKGINKSYESTHWNIKAKHVQVDKKSIVISDSF